MSQVERAGWPSGRHTAWDEGVKVTPQRNRLSRFSTAEFSACGKAAKEDASSKTKNEVSRGVLHIEYARSSALSDGLELAIA